VHPDYLDKIIPLQALPELCKQSSAVGELLVHCHGCFDIVHPGHLHHLRFAARQGDRLIVSITPDRFINKGPGRPIFSEQLRADNLAALSFVDYVVVNNSPTATELLSIIRPDRYIKGAEYAMNSDDRFLSERAAVEQYGGRVVFSGDEVVHSSTELIEALSITTNVVPDNAGFVDLAKQYTCSTHAISKCIGQASGKRVMVLSETIIDRYAHCDVPEVAQEHPMLSLRADREESFDGGGAVIAKHLASMGLDVTLCTPLGDDELTQAFVDRMTQFGIQIEPIACPEQLPYKLRYLVNGEKMMKIDSNTRYQINDLQFEQICAQIDAVGGFDALVVADFGLGLFADRLASRVIDYARDRVGMIMGDVSGRRASLAEMRFADVLCPCEVELRQMLRSEHSPIGQIANQAMDLTGVGLLCVTRADKGLMLIDQHRRMYSIPALCDHPVDVLGCGDALLAGMTMMRLGGANDIQAAYVGSLAAAIEGETRGNLPVSASQLLNRSQRVGAQLALGRGQADSALLDIKSSTVVGAPYSE
jgi:rfaE bifunctional protein kinase chain/domain/rfaE bifunctional protein nucleotidyltransferase chain/domain